MEIERIRICNDQCIEENCQNLHPKDNQFHYKIILEKAKYQIKCLKGQACQDPRLCLDIHEGEIIPMLCQKNNCDKKGCIFTHEDDQFHSQINEPKKQDNIVEAENFKIQGNQQFQENKYYQAIESFTKAIQLNNQNSIYYSNRALCYKKLKQWNNTLQDAQQALSLDFQNLRSRYLITISNVEVLKTERNFDVIDILVKSYKELEKIEKEAYMVQNNSLINLNSEKEKVNQLIQLYSKNQLEYTLLKIIDRSFYPQEDKERLSNVLWEKIQTNKQNLNHKPEYMVCPLTLVDFEEPIITAFGQTYEKTALLQHFQKNGQFDPITRNQINQICIPNLQLALAIKDYNKANTTPKIENIQFD